MPLNDRACTFCDVDGGIPARQSHWLLGVPLYFALEVLDCDADQQHATNATRVRAAPLASYAVGAIVYWFLMGVPVPVPAPVPVPVPALVLAYSLPEPPTITGQRQWA